jgi:hypothetical protein
MLKNMSRTITPKKKKETNNKNQHYETACESPSARQAIYGR